MIPAARIASAAEVLDRILSGTAVEVALVNWGRANRFAGSGDRAAIRDLVFDALRRRASYAALGGGLTGRGLMLGAVRASGADVAEIFSGARHALPPVTDADQGRAPKGAEVLDLPEWLLPHFTRALGDRVADVAKALSTRAPVFLRVNLSRGDVAAALAALAAEGITAEPHPLCATALMVTDGARKVQASQAYLSGQVELQDAASQAVVSALPLTGGMRVLDYCAGGGGKALAMAALVPKATIFAHDAAPQRMRDLPTRAARAGAKITLTAKPESLAPFDLVLADAPCSGSGSWRRDPAGKWRLTADDMARIQAVQAEILTLIAPMVGQGGALAYATCSILREENEDQIAAFLAHSGASWQAERELRLDPTQGGDGFYLCVLRKT